MANRFWWLWGNSPDAHDATIAAEGRWPVAMVDVRSYRAQPVTPAAAPPGWMSAAGANSLVGRIMPVSVGFVEQQSLTSQVNLPPIGPVDDSLQRAHALQAALAASLSGVSNLPR